MDITIKIITIGSKTNMTVGWEHRFGGISSVTDSSNTVVRDINLATIIRATITKVSPPVMAVQWQYGGWQDQSGGVRRSHYFGNSAIRPPPQAAPLAEPPVLVVYLKYKFKFEKRMTIRENNKNLMKNEYFIESLVK